MDKTEVIETLRRELPPTWERARTTRLTGGTVNSGTLANLMSAGKGPAGAFRHGRKVIISREPFIDWLSGRLKPIGAGK